MTKYGKGDDELRIGAEEEEEGKRAEERFEINTGKETSVWLNIERK